MGLSLRMSSVGLEKCPGSSPRPVGDCVSHGLARPLLWAFMPCLQNGVGVGTRPLLVCFLQGNILGGSGWDKPRETPGRPLRGTCTSCTVQGQGESSPEPLDTPSVAWTLGNIFWREHGSPLPRETLAEEATYTQRGGNTSVGTLTSLHPSLTLWLVCFSQEPGTEPSMLSLSWGQTPLPQRRKWPAPPDWAALPQTRLPPWGAPSSPGAAGSGANAFGWSVRLRPSGCRKFSGPVGWWGPICRRFIHNLGWLVFLSQGRQGGVAAK